MVIVQWGLYDEIRDEQNNGRNVVMLNFACTYSCIRELWNSLWEVMQPPFNNFSLYTFEQKFGSGAANIRLLLVLLGLKVNKFLKEQFSYFGNICTPVLKLPNRISSTKTKPRTLIHDVVYWYQKNRWEPCGLTSIFHYITLFVLKFGC